MGGEIEFVSDINWFIDHLPNIMALAKAIRFMSVVPLIGKCTSIFIIVILQF